MKAVCRQNHVVIIIGAGPTGMTLARNLLDANLSVIMLEANPEGVGGGARDSIFWNKDKLKLGIMRKFPDTMAHPRFRYFGGIQVGNGCDVTLEDLATLGPVVLTCGSRGDRLSQICDAKARGIFDANELVRILNSRWLIGRTKGPDSMDRFPLPPMGTQIAMVGMGNVIADSIMHVATLSEQDGKERCVTVLVRRGPFANKIAPAEMKWIFAHIDKTLLVEELRRLMPYLIEQEPDKFQTGWENNPEAFRANLLTTLEPLHIKEKQFDEMPDHPEGPVSVGFKFFSQVEEVHTNSDALTGAKLVHKEAGETKSHSELTCDTLLYSIGSAIDEALSLPIKDGWLEPESDNPYKVKSTNNVFMAGWTRQPSIGLAGVNVKDAKDAEPHITPHCQPVENDSEAQTLLEEIETRIRDILAGKTWTDAATARERLEAELSKKTMLSFV